MILKPLVCAIPLHCRTDQLWHCQNVLSLWHLLLMFFILVPTLYSMMMLFVCRSKCCILDRQSECGYFGESLRNMKVIQTRFFFIPKDAISCLLNILLFVSLSCHWNWVFYQPWVSAHVKSIFLIDDVMWSILLIDGVMCWVCCDTFLNRFGGTSIIWRKHHRWDTAR